jgi:prolyl oligopeptidase
MKAVCLINFFILFSALDINLYAQQPPKAPSQPVTETFFGKVVTDTYRNLENLSDPTVMNWYEAEAAYTAEQLKKLPLRDTIFRELKELDAKFKYTIKIGPSLIPTYRGNYIFYIKTFADEQTGKLYYKPGPKSDDILIFDPNKNNNSGILNVISGFSVNDDGSKISAVVTQQGNEVGRLLIIDTKLKKQVDSIERIWRNPDWIDNETFIYGQYRSADVHNKSFRQNREAKRHVIGKDVSSDPVVLSYRNNPRIIPDSSHFPRVYIPYKNARYIIGHVDGVEQFNEVFLSRFNSKRNGLLNWYPFIKKEDQIVHYLLQGDKAFGLSVRENKKGKILLTSAAKPDWSNARVIAEGVRGSIQSLRPFTLTKDYLYYVESYGVEQTLYRIKLDGFEKQEIKLPLTGMVVPFSISPVDSHLKIFITSWIQPNVIYDFDEAKKSIIKPGLRLTPAVEDLDNVEIEVAYVVSHDGAKVPLTIIKPKGIKKDGSHRVIVYGYGNYGTIIPPLFDPALSVLAKHDIIKAFAHVRGGGEFGEEWRLGGFKSTKPNTWKDAIACAEYMIRAGYTQPSKMAITGASAGGILAGRAMTERPDLFAVAIPQVGVLNTLRFEFTPNGPNHIPEFGTVTNEEDFKNLYAMDSYINIKDSVKYPATLITGGLNDPRVILWQPGKFAARLQEASSSGKPVWFRIDMQGGHGQGSTKDQQFREMADILAFVLRQTSVEQSKPF